MYVCVFHREENSVHPNKHHTVEDLVGMTPEVEVTRLEALWDAKGEEGGTTGDEEVGKEGDGEVLDGGLSVVVWNWGEEGDEVGERGGNHEEANQHGSGGPVGRRGVFVLQEEEHDDYGDGDGEEGEEEDGVGLGAMAECEDHPRGTGPNYNSHNPQIVQLRKQLEVLLRVAKEEVE